MPTAIEVRRHQEVRNASRIIQGLKIELMHLSKQLADINERLAAAEQSVAPHGE